MKRVAEAFCFANGNLVVFNAKGEQIPELQGGWPELWARHAKSLGYNPDGIIFRVQGGQSIQVFKTNNGWNHRTQKEPTP